MLTEARGVVGREAELEAVDRFLAEADGLRALVFEGPAGIGKTTLWRAACDEARDRGYRVLSAAPTASETALSFAALADLLEPVLSDLLQGLPAPQRRALEVALLLTEAGPSPPDPGAVAFAVTRALRRITENGPLVLAVDDVQWLDPPSTTVLAYAARRLGDAPVSLLVARRGEPGAATPLGLDRALSDERRIVIPVGPLSLGAIHHLVRSRLGTPLSRRLLRRTHAVSGGNPFYALEIARAAFASGRAGGELALPDNLRSLVRDRVARLPGATRECLVAVAALADPTVEQVVAATGRPEEALEPAVDDEVIEFSDGAIGFTHPLLASSVEGTVAPARRRGIHARLADVVTDAEERARHLAGAAAGPDAGVAAALDAAAEQARSRGAPAAAAELLEDAARLTPPDEEERWARRTLGAAAAHGLAGESRRPVELRLAVVERLDEGHPLRVEALIDLGLDPSGSLERARERIAQALRETRDVELRASALVAMASTDYVMNEFGRALAAAREAVDLARAAGDGHLLAQALAEVGLLEVTMVEGDPVTRLDEARRLTAGTPRELAYRSPTTWLAFHHLWRDELERARRLLERQYEHAVATGDDESRAGLCLHLVELEWRAGKWTAARRYADEQAELAEQHGGAHERGVSLYARSLVEAYAGNLERARSLVLEGLEISEIAQDRIFPIQHRIVLGFIELTAGDYASAHRHLGELPALLDEVGFRNLGCFPCYPDDIEALIGLGELDEAARLTDELARRGERLANTRLRVTAERCRGLLAAARGDLDGALRHLERALAGHDELPVPFERARTLLALGITQRRVRQKRAARESFAGSLAVFEELGARAWAEKARAEAARISGRGPSSGRLTETERRVADLVAEGRSNKEVARELFVSVKSVEKNLSSIYAKLGVHSRTELARRLVDAAKQ